MEENAELTKNSYAYYYTVDKTISLAPDSTYAIKDEKHEDSEFAPLTFGLDFTKGIENLQQKPDMFNMILSSSVADKDVEAFFGTEIGADAKKNVTSLTYSATLNADKGTLREVSVKYKKDKYNFALTWSFSTIMSSIELPVDL